MEPIPTANLTAADVDELARKTREAMLRELVTLSSEAQKRPIAMPAELK